jgi:hypothetical protein
VPPQGIAIGLRLRILGHGNRLAVQRIVVATFDDFSRIDWLTTKPRYGAIVTLATSIRQ